MDYRVSTNYAIQGQGSLGYADDYRRGAGGAMHMALVSSADPMKAGANADDGAEPGCCSQCCRWGMILAATVVVIAVMVFAIDYKNCHDLPVVGQKDGCGTHHPHPPPHASSSSGAMDDDDAEAYRGWGGGDRDAWRWEWR